MINLKKRKWVGTLMRKVRGQWLVRKCGEVKSYKFEGNFIINGELIHLCSKPDVYTKEDYYLDNWSIDAIGGLE